MKLLQLQITQDGKTLVILADQNMVDQISSLGWRDAVKFKLWLTSMVPIGVVNIFRIDYTRETLTLLARKNPELAKAFEAALHDAGLMGGKES
jgi:hypothetical protein